MRGHDLSAGEARGMLRDRASSCHCCFGFVRDVFKAGNLDDEVMFALIFQDLSTAGDVKREICCFSKGKGRAGFKKDLVIQPEEACGSASTGSADYTLRLWGASPENGFRATALFSSLMTAIHTSGFRLAPPKSLDSIVIFTCGPGGCSCALSSDSCVGCV